MDGVALASVIASASVGLAGVAFGAFNAGRERSTREREAARDREHERALARDARLFDARRDVYSRAAAIGTRLWQYCANVHPVTGVTPDAPMPNDLANADYSALRAEIAAFGTAQAVRRFEDFTMAVGQFELAKSTYDEVRDHGRADLEPAKAVLDDEFGKLAVAYAQLEERIRGDLAGEE